MRNRARSTPELASAETTIRGNVNSALHLAAYIEGDLNDVKYALSGADGGVQSSSGGMKAVPKHSTLLSDTDHLVEILGRCQDKLRAVISALGVQQVKEIEED